MINLPPHHQAAASGPTATPAILLPPDCSGAADLLRDGLIAAVTTRCLKPRPHRALQVHIGLGSDDRFVRGHKVMASALAEDEVELIAGGHDWPVWHEPWQRLLEGRFSARSHA